MAKKKDTDNVVKFTEDELKSLEAVRNDYLNIQQEFGRTKVRKILALKQVDEIEQYGVQLEAAYQQVQDTEATLAKTLEEKYGKGNLNVDTGEFTPIALSGYIRQKGESDYAVVRLCEKEGLIRAFDSFPPEHKFRFKK